MLTVTDKGAAIDNVDPRVQELAMAIVKAMRPDSDIQDDSEMIDLWIQSKRSAKTRDEYRRDVGYFQAWLGGDKDLRLVTLKDLQLYQQACLDRGWKVPTVKRRINAVRSLLKYAVQTGYLHASPGNAIQLPADVEAQTIKSLTKFQIIELIGKSEGRDRALLRLLYATGGRCSEICGLKWKHCSINPDGTAIVALFGKGAKTRSVIVSSATWDELKALRDGADDESPIFVSRKKGGHLDRTQVYRIVAAAAKNAGISGKVSPHWFRHSHATHAIENHVSLNLIQATLGHSSIATTGRYTRAKPTDSSSLHLDI